MFLLALRNLRAHPLRSLLTALAIALGVAMVLAAASVSQTVNERSVRLEQQSQSQNFAGALGDKTAAAPSCGPMPQPASRSRYRRFRRATPRSRASAMR